MSAVIRFPVGTPLHRPFSVEKMLIFEKRRKFGLPKAHI
jgi:hypothetical protein